jgi:ParB-like chromosome segregation protein Spo0J
MSALDPHPLANIFPLLDGSQLQELTADIAAHGLQTPIVIHEGKILDGRNRYQACIEAGVEPRFEQYNGNDPLAYVISLNLKRRHLDESQRAMVAARIATLKLGDNQHSEGLPIGRASELLNIGERSAHRAREVLEEGASELVDAVERGTVSVSAAANLATLPKIEQAEIVARGEKEILAAAREIRTRKWDAQKAAAIARTTAVEFKARELSKFAVIYADPPWRYENPAIGDSGRRIENHYPTMLLEEICALPVRDIAADDAILFLWATAPKLAECMRVIEALGV